MSGRAITEPSDLAHWFPGEVVMRLSVGGEASFSNPGFDVDPELLPTKGTVTELNPPRLLAFTWGDDLLRFELTPDEHGCGLVFTHSFANRASAPRSAAGWNVCIDSLAALLDGPVAGAVLDGAVVDGAVVDGAVLDGAVLDGAAVDGKVLPGDAWAEYHQGYTDRFGSDGTFTRQGDNALLRFERVLDVPAAQVWEGITQPERLGDWLAEGTIDAIEGGRVELHLGNPLGYSVTGTVTRIDAPKVLEFTWTSAGEPAGAVKWQLIPAGDRCILLLTHLVHGHRDQAGTLAAWHVQLDMMASALAGLPTRPFPDNRWRRLHERYDDAASAP